MLGRLLDEGAATGVRRRRRKAYGVCSLGKTPLDTSREAKNCTENLYIFERTKKEKQEASRPPVTHATTTTAILLGLAVQPLSPRELSPSGCMYTGTAVVST